MVACAGVIVFAALQQRTSSLMVGPSPPLSILANAVQVHIVTLLQNDFVCAERLTDPFNPLNPALIQTWIS